MTCAMIILALSSWSEANQRSTPGGAKVKDLMIVSVGAGLVPALCLRLFCFGHPQGVPLLARFVAVVFYVRARVFKLRPCFRGAVTK